LNDQLPKPGAVVEALFITAVLTCASEKVGTAAGLTKGMATAFTTIRRRALSLA
jgi:hypothetical protein